MGLDKYARPVTVDLAYSHATNDRSRSIDDVLVTQTTRQTTGLAVPPFVVEMYGNSNTRSLEDAMSTIVTNPHHGLAVPFLTSYYGTGGTTDIGKAVPTVTTKDRHGLVVPPFIVSYYTRLTGQQAAVSGICEPLPTQPTWPLHYVAQPSESVTIEDCGFRMLQPHELQKAMAFPDNYILIGDSRTKVKLLGNAVTPPVMKLIVERCIESLT